MPYNNHCCAGVAHLVERDLAKVEVASSSLVARSKKKHHPSGWCFFGQVGQRLERARAQREKHAGGMFWCPCACGGPAGPPASLVARSKKHHPSRVVFFSACQKRLAEFAARRRQKIEIIFHRDMCVGKSTSQTASVEFCRLRQNYARSRLQAFCRKNPEGFSTVSPPPSGRCFFALISPPAGCRRAGSAPRGPGGCGENRGRRRRIRSRCRCARP